jgi:hypothetical protein
MKKIEIVPGTKYGRLTVIGEADYRRANCGARIRRVKAKCECGNVGEYDFRSLRIGKTQSCGCRLKDAISKPRVIHKKDNKLLCSRCKEYKHKDQFFNASKKDKQYQYYVKYRDGVRTVCKQCESEKAKEKRRKMTPRDNIKYLVSGAKQRATTHDIPFNIDKEYIEEIYDMQHEKCALSGIRFQINLCNGRNKFAPSIDRIDPKKGYTKGNVRLLCSSVNMMKSDMTDDELINIC